MEEYLVLIYLVLGIALAAIVTRWFNWLAWGQRQQKKRMDQAKRRARLKEDIKEKESGEKGN